MFFADFLVNSAKTVKNIILCLILNHFKFESMSAIKHNSLFDTQSLQVRKYVCNNMCPGVTLQDDVCACHDFKFSAVSLCQCHVCDVDNSLVFNTLQGITSRFPACVAPYQFEPYLSDPLPVRPPEYHRHGNAFVVYPFGPLDIINLNTLYHVSYNCTR